MTNIRKENKRTSIATFLVSIHNSKLEYSNDNHCKNIRVGTYLRWVPTRDTYYGLKQSQILTLFGSALAELNIWLNHSVNLRSFCQTEYVCTGLDSFSSDKTESLRRTFLLQEVKKIEAIESSSNSQKDSETLATIDIKLSLRRSCLRKAHLAVCCGPLFK